jgi:cysteinyl-tRNA synthetase
VGNEIVMQIQKQKKDPAAQSVSKALAAATVEALGACCAPLGLMQPEASEFFARTRAKRLRIRGLDQAVVEAKVKARLDARTAKDFAKADALRAELTAMGIELQDVPGGGGTTWRVKI